MATGTENTFNKALQKFRASLTEEQKRQFSATSLDDVETEFQNIQSRFGSEKKLRNLKKVSKFLEAMKQIEQVIKVFLNVHEAVAFVWGPIKFALMMAGTRVDTLERLLDTYVEIGEVIPGLRQYDQLFKNSPAVREVLERYLEDILQFHRKALDLFARPAWEKFLNSAWKTFDTNFKPILSSLKRHKALLSDEKLTAAIAEIQDANRLAIARFDRQSAQLDGRFHELSEQLRDRFQELSKQLYEKQDALAEKEAREHQEALHTQRRIVIDALGPPNYELDQQRASEQRFSASGDWILKESSFLTWLDSQNPSCSTLYMHGMPGAGKTTLVSRIVDHLRSQTLAYNTAVLFFYFKNHEENKRSMDGMLRALLAQLLYQDDSLIEYFFQKYCAVSNNQLMSRSALKELAQESLSSQNRCLIVLDGLDECGDGQNTTHEEAKAIVEWFRNSVMSNSHSEGGRIRLFLAGQRDGFLNQHLCAYPSINVDTTDAHMLDIQHYAVSRALDIGERFCLSQDKRAEIMERVTTASKGMFLYAKVVLDNLLDQGSKAELADELKSENFPDGLDAAYERVVVRVLERAKRPKRDAAARILGWIICAARPLRWREIQSRFCIDFEQGCCNSDNRRVDSCKDLCGSLVEAESGNYTIESGLNKCDHEAAVDPEIFVSLVHDTAGKYLIHKRHMNLVDEHAKMADFCSRYLTSGPFKPDLQQRSVRDSALSGYYSFQDYAIAFWHHHVESVLNLAADSAKHVSSQIVQSAVCLLSDYEPELLNNPTIPCPHTDEEVQKIRRTVQGWHNNGLKDAFEERTSSIRRVIELVNLAELDDEVHSAFLCLNGSPRFKCPKPHCELFSVGFLDRQTRDAHINEHVRPFKCSLEGCYARTTGFTLQSDLDNHVKRLHFDNGDSQPLFPPSAKKTTNIFTACERGDLEGVKAAVREGLNLNEPSKPKGQITPLILAVRRGYALTCQYLIEHGAQVYPSHVSKVRGSITPLQEVIERQDYDLFRLLVETAGEHERLAFLSRSPNPLLRKYVQVAVSSEACDILKDLLSWYNESPDIVVSTILEHLQQENCGEAIVPILVSHINEARINRLNEFGQTPLHRALRIGNSKIVRALLKAGVDVNSSDADGKTPLWLAIWNGQVDFVKLLLDKGVDPISKDDSGRTPLSWAAHFGHVNVVKLLIEKGADPMSEDDKGRTPLSSAAQYGHFNVVKLLLEKGADPNSMDDDDRRWTPLMWAARIGHIDLVEVLLEEGGDPNIKHSDGWTTLSWAESYSTASKLRLLLENAAAANRRDGADL